MRLCAVVLVLLVLAGCGGDGGDERPETAASAPEQRTESGAGANAPRPVIVDTDLGADDVIALALLLRHPAVDVRAITVSGTGLVHCPVGVGHVRSILLELGVPHRPVGCGRRNAGLDGLSFPALWRSSSDGLYGLRLPIAMGGSEGPDAATVMETAIASSRSKVTIVALGPWTNLEDLVTRHPQVVDGVARVHAMAGAIDVDGNATSAAEWNVRADPSAFAAVFGTGVPITLIPLDATNAVPLQPDFFDRLSASPSAPAANLAWRLLDRNRFLLTSGQYLWDELGAITFVEPTLVRLERVRLRVATAEPDAGQLVRVDSGRQVEAALDADGSAAVTAIIQALRES